jgi:hypothetical protein
MNAIWNISSELFLGCLKALLFRTDLHIRLGSLEFTRILVVHTPTLVFPIYLL